MTVCGFIGTGHMGGALARSRKGRARLRLNNRTPSKAEDLARELGGEACSASRAAKEADFLFLGVKPYMAKEALSSVQKDLEKRGDMPVIVSMLSGVTIAELEALLPRPAPVVRIMPNIPVGTGDGVTMYAKSALVCGRAAADFLEIMGASGVLIEMPEASMDAGAALAGCGPAFAALFAEALADGGVACGLKRPDALQLALSMLEGSAAYMRKTGMHPGQMKDAVCSPGGTTIQGVRALEEGGLRAAAMNAVIRAFEKTHK